MGGHEFVAQKGLRRDLFGPKLCTLRQDSQEKTGRRKLVSMTIPWVSKGDALKKKKRGSNRYLGCTYVKLKSILFLLKTATVNKTQST